MFCFSSRIPSSFLKLSHIPSAEMSKSRFAEIFLSPHRPIPPLKALSPCIPPSCLLIPHFAKPMVGPLYHMLHVLFCLSLTVSATYSHYRSPFQFTQTSGSTSWATLAGRLDSRSIVMVSWLTETSWGRTEIT